MTAIHYEIAPAPIGKHVIQNPVAVIFPMEGPDLSEPLRAESR
jgi:hypothetical protein